MHAAIGIGFRWWFAGTALLFAAACTGSKQMSSGIEGMVTIGPSRPEIQESTSGTDKPFEATIVIKDAATERQVAIVQSAANGQFSIELPPGEYILEPASPRPFVPPYAKTQSVTVQEGQITTVNVVYDSGIR